MPRPNADPTSDSHLRQLVVAGGLAGAVLLAGCGYGSQLANPTVKGAPKPANPTVKVKGKPTDRECPPNPEDYRRLIGDQFKKPKKAFDQMVATSRDTEKIICVGVHRLAVLAVATYEKYQSHPATGVEVYGRIDPGEQLEMFVADKNGPQHGFTLFFGLKPDGQPDLNKLRDESIWSAAPKSELLRAADIEAPAASPQGSKNQMKPWGLSDANVAYTDPLAGQLWPLLDTYPGDIYGVLKNPTIASLHAQQVKVQRLLNTLADVIPK